MSRAVRQGDRVTLHYRLRIAGGPEFESTFGGEPAVVVVGAGELPEALEFLLLGTRPGDRERYEIGADQWIFGEHDEERVQRLAREDFAEDLPPEEGTVYVFTTPAGDELPGVVRAIDDEGVTVDFNHPLVGHDLVFEVEILDVAPAEGG